MFKVTVDQWRHVPAGEKVWNGYPNGYCTAPQEPGFYTLYEVANDDNTHFAWSWVKEDEK